MSLISFQSVLVNCTPYMAKLMDLTCHSLAPDVVQLSRENLLCGDLNQAKLVTQRDIEVLLIGSG